MVKVLFIHLSMHILSFVPHETPCRCAIDIRIDETCAYGGPKRVEYLCAASRAGPVCLDRISTEISVALR